MVGIQQVRKVKYQRVVTGVALMPQMVYVRTLSYRTSYDTSYLLIFNPCKEKSCRVAEGFDASKYIGVQVVISFRQVHLLLYV